LQTAGGGVKIILRGDGIIRNGKARMRTFVAIAAVTASAGGALAGGGEAFVDYYATASTLIGALNGMAADLERLDLPSGEFSDDVADDIKSRLIKAREGFNSILTYDDHTSELNEGYVLYIDKMLLALALAKEYRERGGAEKRARLVKIIAESNALRTEMNGKVRHDKKSWGLD
jgi:hypothetical protein